MWVISVPYSVKVTKKKNFILNLNVYRNANFHTLNKAKIEFELAIKPLLKVLPKLGQIELTYKLFTGTKQLCDTANVCSIVDKFFCDSLVNLGYLEDDNYNYVLESKYCFGGIEKNNPRVEVTINQIQKEDEMQITLVEAEIKQALVNYVREQINVREGMDIVIDLSATRGADGFKATIDIVPEKVEAAPASNLQVAAKVEAATKTRRTVVSSGDAKDTAITKEVVTAKPEVKPEAPAVENEVEVSTDADTTAVDPVSEAEPEAVPVEAEPEPKKVGLFANARRVTNE